MYPGKKMIATTRRIGGAALLLLPTLLLFLAGCGGGGGKPINNEVVLTGFVLDSRKNDEPIEDAVVTIGGKSTRTTTRGQANATRNVGSFELRGVALGATNAVIKAPGYDEQTVGFNPAVVQGNNGPIELIINIGQISGRVLRVDGQPAAGAFVSVVDTGDFVTADESGNFLLTNIPSGTTQISAFLGTEIATKDVTVQNGNTAIGDVQLAEGDSTIPGPPATIVGVVTLANDQGPASNLPVSLFRNGTQIEVFVTDANGAFGFYVPVGDYQIVVTPPPGFQSFASGTITVSNPSVPVTADAVLQPQS